MKRLLTNTAALSWMVVVAVGVFVMVLVPTIDLPSRLSDGQDLLDDAAPAFTAERVEGDRAGITIVSQIVDLADPIATANGGAAAEVPALIAFVAGQTGLSEPDVVAALAANAPKTTALLQALPLSDVTAELPGLVGFLSETLGLTPEEVNQALADNFPRLAQSIGALPLVTAGWENVPGTESLTRFDGSQVQTVPDVRDYFAGDVIPVLERQQGNFRDLDSGVPAVGVIAPILLVVAAIVIVFGLVMVVRSWRGDRPLGEATVAWSVVLVVGVVVILLGAVLFPRLRGGQDLLDDAAPAFTAERVEGDRAGITIVSQIVDLADPIATANGGAAAEVPALIAFVAGQTGLSEPDVVAALAANAPKTTALLQALPLSDVTAELPGLVGFLSETLGLTPEEVNQALADNFPRLAQSIGALPLVTAGWENVPGTESLTRFDGSQVQTVPDVRDYFAGDVIPVLERQRGNFDDLANTPPNVDFFAPFLVLVGVLVVAYGGAMLAVVRFRRPPFPFRPVTIRTA